MGGNIFKNTRRYHKEEYELLVSEVTYTLMRLIIKDKPKLPKDKTCFIKNLKYFRAKQTFGDMDLLVMSDALKDDWQELVIEKFNLSKAEFTPNGELIKEGTYFKNSGVFSFSYKEFQIDLILMPSKDFDTANAYYSWNDLGNLIGRISHKMGLKFGHEGVHIIVRDDSYQVGRILVTKDIEKFFNMIDLNYSKWLDGFDTLEEMFKWVSSTKYFNKEIYALENRNHAARVRDRKRANYNAFTDWCETNEFDNKYPYDEVTSRDGYNIREPFFTDLICINFPHVKVEYDIMVRKLENRRHFRTLFNGDIVSELTGLQNKELGIFMSWLHKSFPIKELASTDLVNKIEPKVIETIINYAHEEWTQK